MNLLTIIKILKSYKINVNYKDNKGLYIYEIEILKHPDKYTD